MTATVALHDLARNVRRAWDEGEPGFYLTSRFTHLPLRGTYLSWPYLSRIEHEVVER